MNSTPKDSESQKAQRYNTLVNSVLVEKEDQERFYREVRHNTWYRAALDKMIDKYIDDLVKEEEASFQNSETTWELVATRIALRKLKSILKIGEN